MDLFIYYRVREADTAQLQARIVAMQAALAKQWKLQGQLKRRPEVQDGMQTWMEVYVQVPADFEPALRQAVLACGATGLIVGQRHSETFSDLAPCA